ncbi:hypothetical protein [Desulfobotulus mexicanus]|uniref:Uncharacterized protein n=1 Tax=Desulfobotulus mexicanus TaxID=2586642 RepID=A0A5S5MBM8_9BACT|nr:hypothetical protein [Desulfobotulus mexicanus]TYT73146.1 hypothetical protein FIM25_16630 [Desulfobotulus mexicanus]
MVSMARIIDFDHKWATLVGRVFIAFGVMESITYECLKDWLKDSVYRSVKNMQFAQRVNLVIDLAKEQDAPKERIEIFISNLNRVKKLAEKRNIIAHNPLVLNIFQEGGYAEGIVSSKNENKFICFDELEQLVIQAEALERELSESKMRLREHEWKEL